MASNSRPRGFGSRRMHRLVQSKNDSVSEHYLFKLAKIVSKAEQTIHNDIYFEIEAVNKIINKIKIDSQIFFGFIILCSPTCFFDIPEAPSSLFVSEYQKKLQIRPIFAFLWVVLSNERAWVFTSFFLVFFPFYFKEGGKLGTRQQRLVLLRFQDLDSRKFDLLSFQKQFYFCRIQIYFPISAQFSPQSSINQHSTLFVHPFWKEIPNSDLSKWPYLGLLQQLMGKKSGRVGKIPAFIKKVKDILEDKSFFGIIQWLPEGNGFQILNTTSFTDKVLPLHFKHRNIASFVRQLNMYGFNRPKDSGQNIYIHPRFQRGNLNSMKLIKRKAGHQRDSSQQGSNQSLSPQKRDSSMREDNQMSRYQILASENEALRKENENLLNKLNFFESMMEKIKLYAQKIEQHIQLASKEQEQDKIQKQLTSNASNCSGDSIMPLSQNSSRKGFSLCNNSQQRHEYSYKILLQGLNENKDEKCNINL